MESHAIEAYKIRKNMESKQIHKSKTEIFFTSDIGSKICLIDPIKCKYRELPENPGMISDSSNICINNIIYLIGGTNITSGAAMSTVHSLDIENPCGLQEKSKLIIPRAYSAVVSFEEKFIYAISGREGPINYGGNTLSSCEKYDIKKNAWHLIPNISKPKGSLFAFILGSQYIYLHEEHFISDMTFEGRIQRLSIFDEELGWERIEIENSQRSMINLQALFAINITCNSVLIFGEQKYNGEGKGEYFFLTKKQSGLHEIDKSKKMSTVAHFDINPDFMVRKRLIYTLGCHSNALIFNTISYSWSYISSITF